MIFVDRRYKHSRQLVLQCLINKNKQLKKVSQTHDLSGSTTVHVNPENTATEVANTLVSMATGHQRGTATVKQLVKYILKSY